MDKELNWKEFKSVNLEDWKEKIIKDLKGKAIEELDFSLDAALTMSPFQHEDSLKAAHALPISDLDFELKQSFGDTSNVNGFILEALQAGVNALELGESKTELKQALKDVKLEYISLHLDYLPHISNIDWITSNLEDPSLFEGSFNISPLTAYIESGVPLNFPLSNKWVNELYAKFPKAKTYCCDVRFVHNNGGNTSDELAMALFMGHEYLNQLIESGISINVASKLIHFKFATSSSFFKEIAKNRSIRLLWARILSDYGAADKDIRSAYISGESGLWNKTTKDPINNLLRLTTETVSAIIGGVNSFNTMNYDYIYEDDSMNSLRRSRNIQHILLEEAFISQVKDAAAGSYFIENATGKLCSEAWKEFVKFDEEKLENFDRKKYLAKIEASAKLKLEKYKDGQLILLGVNKFQNPKDNKRLASMYKGKRIAKTWEEEK